MEKVAHFFLLTWVRQISVIFTATVAIASTCYYQLNFKALVIVARIPLRLHLPN